ncbi:MAG: hypothetical protein AAB288_07610, partial [Acidobacteriota bacterium]
CQVDAAGRTTLIAEGIQRARYRDGNRPTWLEPAVQATVRVRCNATAITSFVRDVGFLPAVRFFKSVAPSSRQKFSPSSS